MKTYKKLAAPIMLLALAACTGTPTNGLIPGSTYQLEELNKAVPRGSAFTQALTAKYRVMAQDELDEHDWLAQQIFAKKGLVAAAGNAPPPEELSEWSVSDDAALNELKSARARLTAMLRSNAPMRAPQWSADAQTNFDCWLHEQHEGWEFDLITQCRSEYMKAMNLIEAPPKVANVEQTRKQTVATQLNYLVFFDFDKSVLSAEAQKIIGDAAKNIKSGQPSYIKVTGYADTSGAAPYNVKLSVRRGEAVKQALIRDGIAAQDISIDGMGEGGLLVDTPDGVREPQNRRAMIDLIGR